MTLTFSILRFILIASFMLMLLSCSSDNMVMEDVIDEELQEILEKTGDGTLQYYTLPESDDYQSIPQDPRNPITEAKVNLGKMLFHEPMIAVKSKFEESMLTYSCASCHHAQGGFQAGTAQGIGDGGLGFGNAGEGRVVADGIDATMIDVQPIRTPSAMNTAFQTNMLWNGQFGATAVNVGTEHLWTEETPLATNELGYEGVEIQAIAGIGVHRLDIDVQNDLVASNSEYKALFDAAFGQLSEDNRYTLEMAGLAIAAYERTLLSNESGFQMWLKGDEGAMTRTQKQGALLFFASGCGSCHTGPALNSMKFSALGMNDLNESVGAVNVDAEDTTHLGRGGFTKQATDNYKFKVPQLYNLKDSPFYGHGSSFNTIKEVIEYKNNGIAQNEKVDFTQLDDLFEPQGFADYEIDLLVDFIENALYDDNLIRYIPQALPSGMCFPNNDQISKEDLGCE